MKKEKIKTTTAFFLPYHDGNNWQVVTIPKNTETYIYIYSPIGYSTKTEIDILYKGVIFNATRGLFSTQENAHSWIANRYDDWNKTDYTINDVAERM